MQLQKILFLLQYIKPSQYFTSIFIATTKMELKSASKSSKGKFAKLRAALDKDVYEKWDKYFSFCLSL